MWAVVVAGGGPFGYWRIRRQVREGLTRRQREAEAEALEGAMRRGRRAAERAAQALSAERFEQVIQEADRAIERYAQARDLALRNYPFRVGPDMEEETREAQATLETQRGDAEEGLALQRYDASMASVQGGTEKADAIFEDGRRRIASEEFEEAGESFRQAEEAYVAAQFTLAEAQELVEEAGIEDTAGLDETARTLEEAVAASQSGDLRARQGLLLQVLARRVEDLKAQQGLLLQRYNAAMASVDSANEEADAMFEEGQRSLASKEFEGAGESFRQAQEGYREAQRALAEAPELAEKAGVEDTSGISQTARALEEAVLACRVEDLRAQLSHAEARVTANELQPAMEAFQRLGEELSELDTDQADETQRREVEYLAAQAREGVATCHIREAELALEEGNGHYDDGAYPTALESYRRSLGVLAEASSYATIHGLREQRNEATRLTQLAETNMQRAGRAADAAGQDRGPERAIRASGGPRSRFRVTAPTTEGQRLRTLVSEIDAYFRDGV